MGLARAKLGCACRSLGRAARWHVGTDVPQPNTDEAWQRLDAQVPEAGRYHLVVAVARVWAPGSPWVDAR